MNIMKKKQIVQWKDNMVKVPWRKAHGALDFLEIINNLKRHCIGSYNFVLMKIKWRAHQFESTQFQHENMSSNGEARSLARYASGLFGCVRKVEWSQQSWQTRNKTRSFTFFSCWTICASQCFGYRGTQSSSKHGSSATTEQTISSHASNHTT